jgi:hypothetical protein
MQYLHECARKKQNDEEQGRKKSDTVQYVQHTPKTTIMTVNVSERHTDRIKDDGEKMY